MCRSVSMRRFRWRRSGLPSEVDRERSVQMRPLKRLMQVRLVPDGTAETRVIPADYAALWERQEHLEGRVYVRVLDAFGPADLYSEMAEGEGRFVRWVGGKPVPLEYGG